MATLAHGFKHIVAALFVVVGFSLPLAADEARIDDLLQQLRDANADNYQKIETAILEEWGKTGSPAMDLLVKRGDDALAAGDPAAALEHFSALVDHAPDFAEGYASRATAYYLLDQFGPALDDARQALVLNPRHFAVLRGFGIMLEELNRPSDALEVYRQVLVMDPAAQDVIDAVDRLELQLEGQTL
jgi:tetratricopeptide (TPR) repeat protein